MEDREIIDLYFARSERAIRETERKYGRQVQGVAYGILRNRADAEECAGDTWLRAWNAMPPQRPDRLGAWLMRVARNLSLDRLRRSGAMKRGEPALALDELTEVVADVRDEADDGEIMAVQHREHPIFGVQFHPESIMTPDGKQMLMNFIEYARRHTT